MESEDYKLASLVLPPGLLDFFTISKVTTSSESLEIQLEEKNLQPEEYSNRNLTSKGFFEEVRIQDFPIRGKKVFLLVKRRRWKDNSNGKIVFRNWDQVATGTRMTKEFAAFLKAIARYQASKL